MSSTRLNRLFLALAFALPVAWFGIYHHFQPHHFVDESGHLGNVYHFLEGKAGWPESMTMLPGYHFIVAALWQLHPPITLLGLARLVTLVLSLLGLAAFALAWQRLHKSPPGPATLLCSLLPLMQPFFGMAYTDVPALAFVIAALAAQFGGQRWLAVTLFLVSVTLRQTNLLWAAFVVAWEWWRTDAPRAEFLRRTYALWALLIASGIVVLALGRMTVGNETGSRAEPNIATLHLGAWLVLLLGLPVWLRGLWRWREAPPPLGTAETPHRALKLAALGIAATGLIVLLTRTYANPHAWNREFWWDDGKFTLLRNWPLIWTESRPWLKVLSAVNVVTMAGALAWAVVRQAHRPALLLTLAFGAVMPATVNLVEPRYFIPGAVFFLLFLRMEAATWRELALWWAVLCALHAPFIAIGKSLW